MCATAAGGLVRGVHTQRQLCRRRELPCGERRGHLLVASRRSYLVELGRQPAATVEASRESLRVLYSWEGGGKRQAKQLTPASASRPPRQLIALRVLRRRERRLVLLVGDLGGGGVVPGESD